MDAIAPFRADHVGSLLRPRGLLELRAKVRGGEAAAEDLRALEDESVRRVVALQEQIGLESVTDGEFRRESFHGDFIERIDGVEFKLMHAPTAPPAACINLNSTPSMRSMKSSSS